VTNINFRPYLRKNNKLESIRSLNQGKVSRCNQFKENLKKKARNHFLIIIIYLKVFKILQKTWNIFRELILITLGGLAFF